LLLSLAIAAVLNQKGTATVVLILGLTGWTGIFRLVRAEFMKHKVREYVQAADAIGATDFSRNERAYRRCDRRNRLQPDVRAYPSQCRPCGAGPALAARGAFHQVGGDPQLPW